MERIINRSLIEYYRVNISYCRLKIKYRGIGSRFFQPIYHESLANLYNLPSIDFHFYGYRLSNRFIGSTVSSLTRLRANLPPDNKHLGERITTVKHLRLWSRIHAAIYPPCNFGGVFVFRKRFSFNPVNRGVHCLALVNEHDISPRFQPSTLSPPIFPCLRASRSTRPARGIP